LSLVFAAACAAVLLLIMWQLVVAFVASHAALSIRASYSDSHIMPIQVGLSELIKQADYGPTFR